MEKIIDELCAFLLFFVVVCLCWAGAEYYIEGGVYPSTVDTYVASILALYMAKDYTRRIRKED